MSSGANRSPQQQGKRNSRFRNGGGGGREGRRARSRSPRGGGFHGRDWHLDGISNDTQRNEDHLKKARIFVGNVDLKSISRGDLSTVFSKHGDVLAVSVHAGYSFIQMDSERSANRAVNYEHGAILNGCKINVEFSTAALKAGARFKQLPPLHQSPPQRGDMGHRDYPPPHAPSSSSYPQRYSESSDLDDRERRLQRILALERELKQERSAMYPLAPSDTYYSGGGGGAGGNTRAPPPTNPFTTGDHFTRRSPISSRKDYNNFSSRRDSFGGGGGGTTGMRRERSLSPRPRPQTDTFSSRMPNERVGNFGGRYSGGGGGGGGYGTFGRGSGPQAW